MATAIAPRQIPLQGDCELIMDFDPPLFRVAFYFHKQGIKGTKVRAAYSNTDLSVALQRCFKESGSPFVGNSYEQAKLIEEYVRATPWGSQLP